ncbi:uncharacterized protein LOC115781138 [Archocentrus centrarchus]|uniref:uncharacterized protein LOC115781138 n=1 Tax=Archocentrus centrarchus TaxID=63155 RepID=UPI0011EA0535|nr:uncharacterized protein LOC115781138 [Archocentrus centrarchus]
MSKVEIIRVLVSQRLNAVAEEIVELFEKTMAEYQDSLARLSEETERQRRLLGTACTAGGPSHQAEFQQVLIINDVPPKEQNSGLPLNGAYLGTHHIKEEQEEMWCCQEGEQLQGVEKSTFSCVPSKTESQEGQENVPYILKVLHGDFQQMQGCNQEVPSEEHGWTPALKREDPEHSSGVEQEKIISQKGEKLMELEENSITDFSFAPVPVKREVDEEEPGSAQLHKMQTENNIKVEPSDSSSTQHMETKSDGEDCGGAEPLTSLANEKTSNSSGSETEDSDDDWKRTTTKKKSHFKVVMDKKEHKSKPVQKVDPAPVNEDKTSDSSDTETEDSDVDLGESKESQSGLNSMKLKEVPARPHSRQHLKKHTKSQTAQMAVHGSQHFIHKTNSDKGHVTTSSAERLLSSSVSKKCKDGASLKAQNSKDETFICSVCGKRFQKKAYLVLHMKMHHRRSNVSGTDGR